MNLVLTWCWKEWRAQRALLLAYCGLVFACLCLGFLLVPQSWWQEEGRKAAGLAWFVAAGVIGVLAFASPALVRGEFGGRQDQFVRRLPGALLPSFAGKALFLLLCTAALPLLGLWLGELYLTARGHGWDDLFQWTYSGTVSLRWPEVAIGSGLALLLVPWVWAIGTWLPGGRMALGGTMLLVLLLGVGAFAVLRQCPNLERHLEWRPWLFAIAPLGVVVAGVSWANRRGGGALRSARFGLATLATLLLAPAAWLGAAAWRYHNPRLARLEELWVQGSTPDGRYVLARGAELAGCAHLPLRIDLATGIAEQWGGAFEQHAPLPGLRSPEYGRAARYWLTLRDGGWSGAVADLATGAVVGVAMDRRTGRPELPAALEAELAETMRATSSWRLPDGGRAWLLADQLCCEDGTGHVERVPWSRDWGLLRAVGHGLWTFRKDAPLFDLVRREFVGRGLAIGGAHAVRGSWVVSRGSGTRREPWERLDPATGALSPCAPLAGRRILGLFDDDHLLCARDAKPRGEPAQLVLYRPADDAVLPLSLSEGLRCRSIDPWRPLQPSALLPRDARGRIWLRCQRTSDEEIVTLDVATREIARTGLGGGFGPGQLQLLAFADAPNVLVSTFDREAGQQIVRIDTETLQRTVLFPRPR